MTAGALLATQWNDPTLVRRRLLAIGGLDVNLRPRATGNGYGVPLETVKLTSVADAGSSTLTASIEDPLELITVDEGAEVRFHDIANDRPLFRGWLDHWGYRPRAGGLGRWIDVDAVGGEATLDWAKLTAAVTLPAGMDFRAAVQSVIAQSSGLGDVRAIASSALVASTAQQAPIAALSTNVALTTLTTAVALAAGTTVREAIRKLGEAMIQDTAGGHGSSFGPVRVTVDEWGGVRVGRGAVDWSGPTFTPGSTVVPPENLNLEFDATGVVRAVYVTGATPAVSGWVTDGTGKPGATVYVNDPNVDTIDKRDNLGLQTIADRATSGRGSLTVTDWTPTPISTRAGGFLGITGGVYAGAYRMVTIDRTFLASGRETWRINFGAARPSIATELRRLTRAVLS